MSCPKGTATCRTTWNQIYPERQQLGIWKRCLRFQTVLENVQALFKERKISFQNEGKVWLRQWVILQSRQRFLKTGCLHLFSCYKLINTQPQPYIPPLQIISQIHCLQFNIISPQMLLSKGILLLIFTLGALLLAVQAQPYTILGCLKYASATSCKTCDSSFGWVTEGGTCKCKKGYANFPGCQSCVKTESGKSTHGGSGGGSSGSGSSTDDDSDSNTNKVKFSNIVGSKNSGYKDKCSYSWSGSGKNKKLMECGLCPSCAYGYRLDKSEKKCVCNHGFYSNGSDCSPCTTHMPGCAKCSGPNTCSSCATGSYYWDNTLSSCKACSSIGTGGCSVCSNHNTCSNCSQGWVRRASDNTCNFCNDTLPGCRSCKTDKICLACNTTGNFRNSTGKCVCNPGHVLKNKQCLLCSVAYPGCTSCTETGPSYTCLVCDPTSNFQPIPHLTDKYCYCKPGYKLQSGVCVSCTTIPGCLTCDNSTGCQSCDSGNPNYLALNPDGTCDCNTGFGKNALGACEECKDLLSGCDICSGPSVDLLVCHSCLVTNGFYEDPLNLGVCLPCIAGCTECDPLDPTQCSTCGMLNYQGPSALPPSICECRPGYTRQGDECIPCADKYMAGCQYCDQTECTSCFNTHFLDGIICKECSLELIGCSTCVIIPACTTSPCVTCMTCDITLNYQPTANTGTNKCDCQDTHLVNSDGECQSCLDESLVPSCARCSTPLQGGCIECEQGLALQIVVGDQVCLPCNDPSFTANTGCNKCHVDGGGAVICESCNKDQRYYPVPNVTQQCESCTNALCQQCQNNIATCSVCYTGPSYNFKSEPDGLGDCVCEDGYWMGTTIDYTCQLQCSAIPGCSKCHKVTGACEACSGANFAPNPILSLCQCLDSTFALSAGACQYCNVTIPNCLTCNSDASCQSCESGYFVDGTSRCSPCSAIPGCKECLTSGCTVPLDGHYFDGGNAIVLCSDEYENCGICTLAGCDACVTKEYAMDTPVFGCNPCSSYYDSGTNPGMVGCLECQSQTECIVCNQVANFSPDGDGGCICADLYALNGTDCEKCPDLLDNCSNCLDKETCIACQTGFQLNSSDLCEPCSVGCLSCDPTIGCFVCDPAAHFFMNESYCNCTTGYSLMSDDTCQMVCGDGIFMSASEQCDDGNLADDDGCSSKCKPQDNWSCSNQEFMRSTCGYQSAMKVSFSGVTKNPSANQITLTFSIGPNITALSKLNFTEAFTSNLKLSNPKFVYNPDGTVSLTYDYSNTLQGQDAQFHFIPSLASSTMYAVDPVDMKLKMTTNDNQPITFYNPEIYDEVPKFRAALIAGQALSYAILAGGMFCNKIIGIELFGVWQVAFFSVSNIDNIQPLLSPLLEFASLNGYNFDACKNCEDVPNRIKAINHQSQISSNLNVMLIVLVLEAVVAGILYGVSYLATSNSFKLQDVARRMLKEYLLMITLFNTLNIGYSIGIQVTYGSPEPLDVIISIVSVGFLVASTVGLTFCKKQQYAEFKSYLRRDWISQSYFQVTIVYRFVLGYLMSQLNESPSVTIFGFFLATGFLMYQIVNLPYRKGYQNYRAMTHQICSIFIIGISMYYRSMKMNEDIERVTTILSPAYLEMISLYGCVAFSLGCLMYELYLKYLKEWLAKLSEYMKNRDLSNAKQVKTIESEVLDGNESFHKSNILWSET